MILSQSDLTALSGYRRPSSVARWLKENGFVYVLGVDGWPRVDTEHYKQRMSGTARSTKRVEPNMDALRRIQK